MTTAYRSLLAEHHIRAIQQARAALARTNDPVAIAKLNHAVDRHVAAINRLDRELQHQHERAGA